MAESNRNGNNTAQRHAQSLREVGSRDELAGEIDDAVSAACDTSPVPATPAEALEQRRLRAHQGRTARADSDIEILHLYLREIAGGERPCSPATIRTYRSILLRFVAWYRAYRYGQPLRDLSREDVLAYQDFLRDPPSDWIGPRHSNDKRATHLFVAPLSQEQVQRNCRVISTFIDYAISQGRLAVNPFHQPKAMGHSPTQAVKQERYLDPITWKALWRALHRWVDTAAAEGEQRAYARALRARWVIEALYIAALRADELASSSAGQLYHSDRGYRFEVPASVAKGNKAASIPVPVTFVERMSHYRQAMGIAPAVPRPGDGWPMVLDLTGRRRVTTRQVFNIATEAYREGADELERVGETDRAETLRHASGHWMRHSRATHLLDAGVDRRLVRSIMRHSRDSTLDQYTHADDQRKHDAAELGLEELVPDPSSLDGA